MCRFGVSWVWRQKKERTLSATPQKLGPNLLGVSGASSEQGNFSLGPRFGSHFSLNGRVHRQLSVQRLKGYCEAVSCKSATLLVVPSDVGSNRNCEILRQLVRLEDRP